MPLVDLNGLAHFKDKENAMMAADYSASSTYAVGDYVYYNGTLYRCTTAITTAEAWTSGHWTAAALGDDVTSLKNAFTELYNPTQITDIFNTNTSVVRTDNALTSASWNASTKTVSVTMSDSNASADTYYVVLSPKLTAGHTYKIPIEYTFSFSWTYVYVRNAFSSTNFNSRDDIINGTSITDGDSAVYEVTATQDGWLALGVRVGASRQESWSFKVAVYDITGADVSGISDSDFLEFPDSIIVSASGIIANLQTKVEYVYDVASNVKGETWSALGDSLTATGSGSQYLSFVKSRLGLADYVNCGIGGTAISGATNTNAMYQDVRINTLDIDSNCVTVMGGTNDFWQQYYDTTPSTNMTGWGDCSRDNYDVSTFCGAYNVLISKILYKFCRVAGYYENVDYTGITQATTAVDNFRLILINPPQQYYVDGGTASATLLLNGTTKVHEYVAKIAELWSLPCVDAWEMGMNDMNKSLFFADATSDATHFNAFGHQRLASLIIDKALQISRYN